MSVIFIKREVLSRYDSDNLSKMNLMVSCNSGMTMGMVSGGIDSF